MMDSNKLRMLCNFMKVKIARQEKPLFVGFAVTSRCNCHCQYCNLLTKGPTDELKKEQIMVIIELA